MVARPGSAVAAVLSQPGGAGAGGAGAGGEVDRPRATTTTPPPAALLRLSIRQI